MLRANLVEPQKIVMEQVEPPPEPGPGEVRLRIETCGICGSDIHAYYGEHPYINCPVQPGHEFTGTIDQLGAGVTGWESGQRVTAEPSLVCGACENCLNGNYHICYNLRVIGCQSDGALAEYLNVPAKKLVALPDNMTFEQGSFVEPLAVGVHFANLAQLQPDTRLLILGSGTIGLMCLLAARARGVTEITVTDPLENKLALARELGAKYTVNVAQTSLAAFAREMYGTDLAYDVACECVGAEATIRDGIGALKKGGTLIVGGVFPHEVPVNLGFVQDRELKLIGSLMYQMHEFVHARDLIATGRAVVDALITARYSLEQVPEALQAIDANPAHNVKTMIHIRPQES